MRYPRLIVAAVLVVLLVILIVQNTESVETRILFISFTMPRAVLLGVTLVLGWLIGIITSEVIDRSPKRPDKE